MRIKFIIAPLSVFLLAACSIVQNNVVLKYKDLSNVRFLGKGESTSLVIYSGINSDLYLALQNIIPADWIIKLPDAVSKSFMSKVSWDAGEQWLYVLDKVMRANSLYAYVDWDKKRVDIAMHDNVATPNTNKATPKNSKFVKTTSVTTPRKSETLKVSASPPDITVPIGHRTIKFFVGADTLPPVPSKPEPASAGVNKPLNPFSGASKSLNARSTIASPYALIPAAKPVSVKPMVLPSWRAEVGSTLHSTLIKWSKEETCNRGDRWRITWNTAKDYSIDSPLIFNGVYLDVIVQLFSLYKKAESPLYADVYKSQCLIIVNDSNKK